MQFIKVGTAGIAKFQLSGPELHLRGNRSPARCIMDVQAFEAVVFGGHWFNFGGGGSGMYKEF